VGRPSAGAAGLNSGFKVRTSLVLE